MKILLKNPSVKDGEITCILVKLVPILFPNLHFGETSTYPVSQLAFW